MLRLITDFLRPPRLRASRTRVLLMVYFLSGLAVVLVGAVVFAGRTTQRMDRQAQALLRVFSLFLGETAFFADQPGAREIIENVLNEVDFPVIITDASGVPLIWRRVGVPPPEGDVPGELGLRNLDPESRARLAKLQALTRDLDARNPPHPIHVDGVLQAHLHFGSSQLSRRLQWMPIILVLVVAIFMSVGLLVFRYMKLGEQRALWVGMARETAHQLGTPLTSLLGWVQLLQGQDQRVENPEDAARRRHQTYEEMERDLERLTKVSARFSKIGARPDLAALDPAVVLRETVEYVERRIPHLGSPVHIRADLGPLQPVLANRELLEWAFENLLKNALDALEQGGEIRVQGHELPGDSGVEIRISDSGRGIPPTARKRIWEPGFTTKRRGWGVGLVLVQRIIEEYHGGHIWIEDNPDRRGVCFVVRLPLASSGDQVGSPGDTVV